MALRHRAPIAAAGSARHRGGHLPRRGPPRAFRTHPPAFSPQRRGVRMKTCFIFNPHSGRNRGRPRFAGAIREFIASRSLDANFSMTEGPGHATELACEAVRTGHELVVAVGGDGTMNEVAQGLID